jgi:hypothetical protein
MSGRERRNRKDAAAAAVVRFAELWGLMRERALLRVCAPVLLAELREGGCSWAAELRGVVPELMITWLESGGAPADAVARTEAALNDLDADLSARIAAFAGDEPVGALLEAEMALLAAESAADGS